MHKLTDTHPAGSAQPCPAGKEREMVGVWRKGFAVGKTVKYAKGIFVGRRKYCGAIFETVSPQVKP